MKHSDYVNKFKKEAISFIPFGIARRDQLIKRPKSSLQIRLEAMGADIGKIKRNLNKRLPPMRYPVKTEKEYTRFLRLLVKEWRDLYKELVDPRLEDLIQQATVFMSPTAQNVKTDEFLDGIHLDTWTEDLQGLMEGYRIAVDGTLSPVSNFVENVGEQVSGWNREEWQKVVTAALGVPVFNNEPWLSETLAAFVQQNVTLVKNLAETTANDIERIIFDGANSGQTVRSIRQSILGTRIESGRFKKTRHRADLIAADQVGKLNGQLTRLRQTDLGLSRYVWRTAKDERVRANHSVMEGKLCQWKNATVYKNSPTDKKWKQRSSINGVQKHPGQDYRCRCYPEADFTTVL